MGVWDPAQYDRFQEERRQPFFDLMELVETRPTMRVADLGCGTGELTRALHRHLSARETLGIDNSESMLARSAAFAGRDQDDRRCGSAGVRFELGHLAEVGADGTYDLLFSNAALHWLPDHEQLIARLARSLAADGQIAIQVPANHGHPSHVIADEVAAESPFREALEGYSRGHSVLEPREYALLLRGLGFARQRVRLQVYVHELGSADDVVEWVKGTLLTAYQRRLSGELYAQYLERYRARLRDHTGDPRPFLYTYDRILMWAAEPGVAAGSARPILTG